MPTILLHPLSHFDERPPGTTINTLVIHSMYTPDSLEPFLLAHAIQLLDSLKLSAHYLIGRKGELIQLVDPEKRAWHAGVSRMPFPHDARENVNHFSIGIELIGAPHLNFTRAQYSSLTSLTLSLTQRYPLTSIVGHHCIAPERKTDPGERFDWKRYAHMIRRCGMTYQNYGIIAAIKNSRDSLP